MFTTFLFTLRAFGLKVSLTEWLTFLRALTLGFDQAHLGSFYALGRALLVKREAEFDDYDRAFAHVFGGVSATFNIDDELLDWLKDPVLPKDISPDEFAQLKQYDLDELKKMFEERRAEQNERHDGGNKWIGTGGTSPFGHGGKHPAGVRIGGPGGGRSAVQIAEERRFQNLRTDRVLDTRQISVALRRLRRLAKAEGREELHIDLSVDQSAKNGGEIELVFAPPRENKVRLLLLVDVGGSMDPHADLCERVFSAAHASNHFRSFEAYSFHNCPYETLYTDMQTGEGVPTEEVLKKIDHRWNVVIVGDAWMSPYELTHVGGAIYYHHQNAVSGLDWLRKLKHKAPKSVWLNPEPERIWAAESIRLVRQVYPMYELTIDGLTAAIDDLRGAKAQRSAA